MCWKLKPKPTGWPCLIVWLVALGLRTLSIRRGEERRGDDVKSFPIKPTSSLGHHSIFQTRRRLLLFLILSLLKLLLIIQLITNYIPFFFFFHFLLSSICPLFSSQCCLSFRWAVFQFNFSAFFRFWFWDSNSAKWVGFSNSNFVVGTSLATADSFVIMGNVNGREDGGGSPSAPEEESGGGTAQEGHPHPHPHGGGAASELMGQSPPHSPRATHSPLMFTPQVSSFSLLLLLLLLLDLSFICFRVYFIIISAL